MAPTQLKFIHFLNPLRHYVLPKELATRYMYSQFMQSPSLCADILLLSVQGLFTYNQCIYNNCLQ